MSEVYDVILGPLVTEKSALQQDENIYAFRVGERSSKIEIKSAIEDLFGVEVLGVRTARVRGKVKRFGRFFGKRKNWKKAYVTLAEGNAINLYENV
jgi:large subunit ribosomal protein L23